MTLIFFPVKAEVLYFLIQRRFNIMDSLGAPYGKKGAFYFAENPFFSKKWILAPKRRLFDFSALTMSEMEKATYF